MLRASNSDLFGFKTKYYRVLKPNKSLFNILSTKTCSENTFFRDNNLGSLNDHQ